MVPQRCGYAFGLAVVWVLAGAGPRLPSGPAPPLARRSSRRPILVGVSEGAGLPVLAQAPR